MTEAAAWSHLCGLPLFLAIPQFPILTQIIPFCFDLFLDIISSVRTDVAIKQERMNIMTKQFTGRKEWANRRVTFCPKSRGIPFGRAKAIRWKQKTSLLAKLQETGRGKPTSIMFPSLYDITLECRLKSLDDFTRMLPESERFWWSQCLPSLTSRALENSVSTLRVPGSWYSGL